MVLILYWIEEVATTIDYLLYYDYEGPQTLFRVRRRRPIPDPSEFSFIICRMKKKNSKLKNKFLTIIKFLAPNVSNCKKMKASTGKPRDASRTNPFQHPTSPENTDCKYQNIRTIIRADRCIPGRKLVSKPQPVCDTRWLRKYVHSKTDSEI